MTRPPCLVIGHRGAMAYAPENTAASFRLAQKLGVDAVECDVHRARDGTLVVIHDPTLDRTTSGHGFVKSHTWSQLKKLDAGSWFGKKFQRERLWRLSDFLSWARRKKGGSGRPLEVIVEMKNAPVAYPGLGVAVAQSLQRHGMVARTWLISFEHETVRQAKRAVPSLRTGLLFSKPLRGLARRMKWAQADAVFPRYSLINRSFLAQARRAGWFVGTWTVNEISVMKRLRRWGVDAIASNVPDILRRLG